MFTETPPHTESPIQMFRMPMVITTSGRGRSTIYRMVSEGLWTPPVRIGARAVAWPASEVAALNAARIMGMADSDIRKLVVKLTSARRHLREGL